MHVCDVRDREQVKALFADLAARIEGIDTLVTTSGTRSVSSRSPSGRHGKKLWDALYAVNLRHLFSVSQAALAAAAPACAGATIVNVSSIEAFRAIPMCPVYAAFKAGITGFTKSLALIPRPRGHPRECHSRPRPPRRAV